MKLTKRVVALMMTTVMLATAFAGCKGREEETSEESVKPSGKPEIVTSKEGSIGSGTPDFMEIVTEHKEENSDTIGWLDVPETGINEVVVQGEDNQYYHRRNFEKEYDFGGIFYADKRVDMGDGTRESLPVNLTIYGHALTDNPEHKNYNVKFGPLHDFRDVDKANQMPYIFFSTDKGNYAYEVIGVFLANSDNPDVPYNVGDVKPEDYIKLVKEELLPRSLYDYGAEIKDDDKFITLSTCIYVLEDGTLTNYPNTYYRYCILGRLVDEDAPLINSLSLTVNEDRIIDKDGKMAS